MIRRPPRSTLDRSSAASDVYKRQVNLLALVIVDGDLDWPGVGQAEAGVVFGAQRALEVDHLAGAVDGPVGVEAVSYTHLRAHETVLDLVCRLLLENKNDILC